MEVADNRDKIEEWEASALTSDPPIIVKFDMTTSLDYVFPYGETDDSPFIMQNNVAAGFLPVGSIAAIMIGALILIFKVLFSG
jgi:hypothetical protein